MVFGSFLDCDNSNNLEEMGKEVEDVEEGEISDTASVEEISEEDFNKQDVVKVNNNSDKVKSGSAAAGGGDSRVWAVQDLYSKYPTICRGYASGLYNLAWAQAVQNKPLNDIFVMELDSDSNVDANANSNNSSNNDADSNRPMKEIVVVDDDDKEEGELEEGEIDGDDDTDCVMLSGDAFETVSDSEVLGVKTVLEGITVANVAE
jgi:RNA polymerase II C-terminal domain phosphatase-like 3/4